MRRLAVGLLWAVAGYLLGAFVGYWVITFLSANVHDRSVEAAMTAAFVCGPIGALSAFFAGLFLARRRPASPAEGEA